MRQIRVSDETGLLLDQLGIVLLKGKRRSHEAVIRRLIAEITEPQRV